MNPEKIRPSQKESSLPTIPSGMEIGDGNPTKYEEVEQKIGQIFVPQSQVSREKVFRSIFVVMCQKALLVENT